MKRNMYSAHDAFIKYQNDIANNPIYAGMPDLYCDDNSIQWEAPSNRGTGKFKDTHDKRLKWWKEKAESIGIDTSENQWISRTAKTIHPTKIRLTYTSLKVSEITQEVGFADSNYYCKLFTQKYGVSPRNYRTKKKNNLPI